MYSVAFEGVIILYRVTLEQALKFIDNNDDYTLLEEDLERQKIHGAGSWFEVKEALCK